MKKETLKKLDEAEKKNALNSKTVEKLLKRFSEDELKKLADSGRLSEKSNKVNIDFSGSRFKAIVMTDTHIGSAYDNTSFIESAFKIGKRDKVDMLIHAGDLLDGDGMDKKGYVYDLRTIGYDNQRIEAEKIFSLWDKPAYFISGNHDLHAYKSSGIDVVKTFCDNGKNRVYLGQGKGELRIKNIIAEIFHGEDSGSGYIYSYRIQQITRGITGGHKPNILITGHDHKALYVYTRMIHALAGGACSQRSRWMQMKRLEHHSGFWEIDVCFNSKGVSSFKTEFFPFYC
jgi:predicted phosphodiesterase